jgi:NAD(P)-dependent dehydrogenase (short-subunit alcohol dehydrogenase family)
LSQFAAWCDRVLSLALGAESFAGRVAFVTGAARGIGQASALAFAQRGAEVAVCDILDGAETVKLIEAAGSRAVYVETDVTRSESVQEAVRSTVATFGQLDFAHNNAGMSLSGRIDELAEDDWHRVISTNLTGVFLCMKYQLPHLIKVKGAIVNTASIWGVVGAPNLQSAYAASKHGVAGLTKTAAIEYGACGVRVNAVAPGPIRTPPMAAASDEMMAPIIARTAENRVGQPAEVGGVVAWLCSSAASYVNGVVMPIDGGWLAN